MTVTGRASRSVSVEQAGPKFIVVGEALGRAGERGAFVYQTPAGRFRFGATIVRVEGGMTYFQMPTRVESLAGGGAQKRSSVRLDTLVAGQWRMAPGGQGVGVFMKGSIRDISRGGCALIMDRSCKVGQWLEVTIALRSDAPAIAALAEIVRVEQVPASGKFSHGLRFHGLQPAEDHAILDYINKKTAELRSRGLA
ncbi:MAG: PilZ domain-containing protein [Candidatus Baltobacteraceae bacterium]